MQYQCRKSTLWLITICTLLHIGARAQPFAEQVKALTANRNGALDWSNLYLTGYAPTTVLRHIKNTFTGLLVVEFSHTGFCRPCLRFAPIFEQAAQQMNTVSVGSHKVQTVFVSIDGNKVDKASFQTAQTILDVRVGSVPSIYFFCNGSYLGEAIGFQENFRDLVESYATRVS